MISYLPNLRGVQVLYPLRDEGLLLGPGGGCGVCAPIEQGQAGPQPPAHGGHEQGGRAGLFKKKYFSLIAYWSLILRHLAE